MSRARRFVRIRFLRLAAVLAVCTLLLIAPVMLGRMTQPRYAVSPVGVLRDSIAYTLTDTDRRITVSHWLDAADITDAQWLTAPPLIVQRIRDGEQHRIRCRRSNRLMPG